MEALLTECASFLPCRVDVYSLGCILNECMTRRQPWRGVSNHGGFIQVLYLPLSGLLLMNHTAWLLEGCFDSLLDEYILLSAKTRSCRWLLLMGVQHLCHMHTVLDEFV